MCARLPSGKGILKNLRKRGKWGRKLGQWPTLIHRHRLYTTTVMVQYCRFPRWLYIWTASSSAKNTRSVTPVMDAAPMPAYRIIPARVLSTQPCPCPPTSVTKIVLYRDIPNNYPIHYWLWCPSKRSVWILPGMTHATSIYSGFPWWW